LIENGRPTEAFDGLGLQDVAGTDRDHGLDRNIGIDYLGRRHREKKEREGKENQNAR